MVARGRSAAMSEALFSSTGYTHVLLASLSIVLACNIVILVALRV